MKKSKIWIFGASAALIGAAGYIFAATSFTPDDEPTNYLAALAITNNKVTSGNEYVFKTDFEKDGWKGNVYALHITSTGAFDGKEAWERNNSSGLGVGEILDLATTIPADRKIVTMKSDGTKVPFIATAGGIAPTGQLDRLTVAGATTTQVLDFIRGVRCNELGNTSDVIGSCATKVFRARKSRLGDIIHSRPFYSKLGSKPTLFVGANDGMLHVFDATTPTGTTGSAVGGDELWAYIPSMLIPKLNQLAVEPYSHKYYVDGGLTVGDASIGGSPSRVLVSGLGAGGRGLFALNVTNPVPTSVADAASKILWEITPTTINNAANTDYANLGFTYGTPVVAKVNTGADVVIVGNGYNSGGSSSLYVINAATGAKIREIVTAGAANGGLSSPRCLDNDGDAIVDYCYAGDIDGKLWKFNLTATTAGSWTASQMSTAGTAVNSAGTVITQTANTQPITMAPSLVVHPFGGYMVIFGTGSAFSESEKTSTTPTNYMYGIWDALSTPVGTGLLEQTLAQKNYVTSTDTRKVRVITSTQEPKYGPLDATDPSDSAAKHHKGWRVALEPGERVLGDEIFTDSGRVLFNLTNPTATGAPAVGAIPAIKGDNWLMELNSISGGTLNIPFLNMNTDSVVNADDRVKYVAGDVIPDGSVVGDNNLTKSGVPVGKLIGNGLGSHPLLIELTTLFTTIFNQNPDFPAPTPGTPPTDRGVAGGHFDLDIYYPTFGTESRLHNHEYDDVYDATGVNMLNAGNPGFNLINAIASTSTPFKVLIQNQYLNPAVTLNIGPVTDGSTGINQFKSVKFFGGQAKETDPNQVLANSTTYTRSDISRFAFNMPVTAFSQKDWWGDAGGTGYVAGDIRVGLHPTKTGCVKKIVGDSGNLFQGVIPPVNGVDGPGTNSTSTTEGARHNGALVIQLIKDTIKAAEIELNVAGRPEYGWRVKSANFANQVLAEYTVFWHHPNGLCYGDTGWTKLAVPDNSPADPKKFRTPAAGSTDPKYGSFLAGGVPAPGTSGSPIVNGEGSATGGTGDSPNDSGEQTGTRAKTGRLSWTELHNE